MQGSTETISYNEDRHEQQSLHYVESNWEAAPLKLSLQMRLHSLCTAYIAYIINA